MELQQINGERRGTMFTGFEYGEKLEASDSDQVSGEPCEARCSDLVPSKPGACHEIQEFGHGPEAAESARAWRKCSKNPGHGAFIPASQFSMEHMPTTCKDKDWLEFVKTVAYLTVRIRVLHTSPNRPATGTFSVGEDTGPVTGTGFIYEVRQTPESSTSTSTQSEKSWDFKVNTAAHVVFDSIEAEWTLVDLYYNEEESPIDGTMKSLRGVKVLGIKQEHDICWLLCRCTNEDLAMSVRSHRERLAKLQETTNNACILNKESGTDIIIVSHPHGQPKKITVGKLTHKSLTGSEVCDLVEKTVFQGLEFEYSADTCPGSSGAPIVWLDDWWWGDRPKGWVFCAHSKRSDSFGFNNGTGLFYL